MTADECMEEIVDYVQDALDSAIAGVELKYGIVVHKNNMNWEFDPLVQDEIPIPFSNTIVNSSTVGYLRCPVSGYEIEVLDIIEHCQDNNLKYYLDLNKDILEWQEE